MVIIIPTVTTIKIKILLKTGHQQWYITYKIKITPTLYKIKEMVG